MVNTQVRAHRLWPTPYGQLLRSDGLKRLTEQMLSLIAQRRGESVETEREARRRPPMTLRHIDRLPAPGDSLAEHLSRQLHMGWRDPLMVALGDWIIWNLESDGYLREDLDDLAAAAGASVSELETGLAIVQSLEPTGVAARSLRECLLLQLHGQAAPDPVAMRLVDGHLPALAAGRHGEVARSLDLPLERIERALAAIRRLEPRPGRPFGTPGAPAGRSWAASHRPQSDERLRIASSPRSMRSSGSPRLWATSPWRLAPKAAK